MTWIKTVPLSQAEGPLREAVERQRKLYPPEYGVQVPGLPTGDAGGIVAAHSLIPEALEHAFSTFGALMSPDLPLSRRQQELIAAAVSVTNFTHYCGTSHVEFLRGVTEDDALAQSIALDPSTAPLDATERALVDYAQQVTRDATLISPAHHQRLRDLGFDDRGILQITLIAAWFNYINRVADALGVGRPDPALPSD
jgi:uncharacterized peroxidase-related enzyme